jgi:hypothetical protein
MSPQLPFQFRCVSLHPAPHRHVIGFQAALDQEFFDISVRTEKTATTNPPS